MEQRSGLASGVRRRTSTRRAHWRPDDGRPGLQEIAHAASFGSMTGLDSFIAAGGGFLVAVIWMDLMFDVLALRERSAPAQVDAVSQIAAYYRRVTSDASPMNLLVSIVMAGIVGGLLFELWSGGGGVTLASLSLCAVPISLALLRVFPNAVRLGSRVDTPEQQQRLARAIAVDHLFCLAAMLAFVVVRIAWR